MARSSGWVLWSRDGYRGRADLAEAPAAPTRTAEVLSVGMPERRPRPAHRGDSLVDQIIADRSVEIEYQAVIDARRNQVVGFEALSRGPAGPLQSPVQLFSAARAVGRLGELDWICRAAAFQGMLAAGLPPSLSLFVNVEADSLMEPCPDDLLPVMQEAEKRLRVLVDLTGRALARYPSQVLETVRRARAAGWGISVGDVAYSNEGLALLPTIEPDVIKLDQRLLTSRFGQTTDAVLAALAECEQTGAVLLVERVENPDHALTARAFGAAYQQGRLIGREGPLPTSVIVPRAPLPLLDSTPDTTRTPWQVLVDGGAHRTDAVDGNALEHIVQTVASQACAGARPPMVAAVTPQGATLDPVTESMWRMMLERCPLVVIVGPDVSVWNDWRIRAADLPAGHKLAGERCFLVLSPTVATVVAARAVPGTEGRPPTWDVVISQQPSLCRAALRRLLDIVDTLQGGIHHGA
jgi:EAL domain-containing protein (putative c-di-GMP-specific phosphodiesterase class I)